MSRRWTTSGQLMTRWHAASSNASWRSRASRSWTNTSTSTTTTLQWHEGGYSPLHKIQPLISSVSTPFSRQYRPGRDLSITMVAFKGAATWSSTSHQSRWSGGSRCGPSLRLRRAMCAASRCIREGGRTRPGTASVTTWWCGWPRHTSLNAVIFFRIIFGFFAIWKSARRMRAARFGRTELGCRSRWRSRLDCYEGRAWSGRRATWWQLCGTTTATCESSAPTSTRVTATWSDELTGRGCQSHVRRVSSRTRPAWVGWIWPTSRGPTTGSADHRRSSGDVSHGMFSTRQWWTVGSGCSRRYQLGRKVSLLCLAVTPI